MIRPKEGKSHHNPTPSPPRKHLSNEFQKHPPSLSQLSPKSVKYTFPINPPPSSTFIGAFRDESGDDLLGAPPNSITHICDGCSSVPVWSSSWPEEETTFKHKTQNVTTYFNAEEWKEDS